jgi:hypothetical protein
VSSVANVCKMRKGKIAVEWNPPLSAMSTNISQFC